MKKLVLARLLLAAVAASMTVAVFPSLALADGRPNVAAHVTVGGVDLYGMTEADASATISSVASLTALPQLVVKAPGKTYYLKPSKYLTLNVEGVLDRVYSASADATGQITPSFVVSATPVNALLKDATHRAYRKAVNASYYVKSGKLKVRSSVSSRALYTAAARKAIYRALVAEATTRLAQPAVTLPTTTKPASVTVKKLPRAILVDLSQRRLWLFAGTKKIVSFGIAIGMPGHSTPTGSYTIVRRSSAPTWRNPGSDWAKNMPAYIPPGPSNPLGLRALYLDNSAPGIRIHGTNKYYSIGHAASHGCMRMRNKDIVKFYPKVPVGTKVFIVK